MREVLIRRVYRIGVQTVEREHGRYFLTLKNRSYSSEHEVPVQTACRYYRVMSLATPDMERRHMSENVTPEVTMIERTIAESAVAEKPAKIDYTKIDQRVMKGVRFLDANVKGWANKIKLDRFALTSSTDCVLGQLYGEYDDGLTVLFGKDQERDRAFELGFSTPVDDQDWAHLNADWITVIKERQTS